MTFAQDLSVEEERHFREGLSEEELSVFDLLTQADLPLGEEDERQVKVLARTLLATLKRDKLQIDWRKYQQSRSAVRVTIEQALDEGLPDVYDIPTYQQAADAVFEHVFELYAGGDQESPSG